MTTDINEIYKRYPCAKHQSADNIKFWSEKHDNEEDPCFDVWIRTSSGQDDIYNFLELLESHDIFLLKRNELTPEEEEQNREVGRRLSNKYLKNYEDEYMWHRINAMDWGKDCPDESI